jgi:signal transduction histidine kinase/ligand-binding sensor domain-containing protein/DNA-binding NarL/FixJ family response regulator
MKLVKLICILFFIVFNAAGQREQLFFEHLTQKDGLSQSSVFSIFQDKQGFMWFGTRDGLNRYDGYKFKIFQHIVGDTFSISSNEISTITDDTCGNLWIGTIGGGLNIFDPIHERFYNNNSFGKLLSATQQMVNTIFRDSKGNMWIGTRGGLYLAVADKNFSNNHKITLSEISDITGNDIYKGIAVRHILESKRKNLLLATDNGLFYFNPETKIIKQFNIPNAQLYIYTSSYQENDNTFWFGSFDYGLFRLTFKNNEEGEINNTERFNTFSEGYYNMPNQRAEAMIGDKNGNLWVSTRSGVVRFKLSQKTKDIFKSDPINSRSISDNRNNSLFIDNTGILWIGAEYQGINKVNLNSKPFLLIRNIPGNNNSLINNYVSAISGLHEDAIFIGTDGSGFDLLNINKENKFQFTHFNISSFPSLLENQIISLVQDRNGIVWLGWARNSLGEFNPATKSIKYHLNPGHIFSLCRGSGDFLWIGTWIHGLFRYNIKTGTFEQYLHNNNPNSISIDIILSTYEDNNKVLWVGTKGGGLNCLKDIYASPSTAEFTIYKHIPDSSSSLSNNDVNCILQTKDNTIWVCTADGLNKVIYNTENNLQFKSYLQKDGLPNSFIYGALEDSKGNLWLSTNKGISRFDPKTEEFKNYDQNDGLQSDEFRHNAYFKDEAGNMYFGGNNGLNIFNPDSIKENSFIPKVVITDIKIPGKNESEITSLCNQSIPYIKEIELTYKEKEISIEFTALHYAVPHKNQYKYRLKGFNSEWQVVSSNKRSATYTNLDQGDYVFQVKASNNDGIWNETPVELKIKVLPPPWKSIWAIISYIILIASALLIFRNYSLIAVKEKNKLIIEHLEREKFEELSKLKIQFFTNVSHELRTPLTLINSPLEELLLNEKLDEYSKQQLGLMQRNVNRLLQMINQLLDFRKIDSGLLKLTVSEINIIELINDVSQSFIQHAETRNINFHFLPFQDSAILWIDKEKVRTILFNLLSNAFKYSPDGSTIIIETNAYMKEFKPRGRLKKLMHVKSGKKIQFFEIKITDTGIGIEKHQLKKIFDRFYQASESPVNVGGSGIGLAISREYIEMHGGTIDVESTINKGSCFTILIPFDKEHFNNEYVSFVEVITTKETVQNLLATEENKTFEKPNQDKDDKPLLLFVEDNQELCDYLVSKLNDQYKVEIAMNGLKGIEIAIERNPDLIITDLMMPELDGIEMCRKLKTEIQTSHIPIIILTAKSTEENTVEGLETGADVYIIKPFSINILKAQIKSLLDTRQKLKNNFNRQLVLQPKEVAVTSIDERFMKKLLEVVEANIADPNFGIKEMTTQMNMSHSVLFRKIKSLTGLNVVEFMRSFRLKKAALILAKKKIPISEVSFMTGFSDPKYFSKCFQKEFGMTPTDYSNKQERA